MKHLKKILEFSKPQFQDLPSKPEIRQLFKLHNNIITLKITIQESLFILVLILDLQHRYAKSNRTS